MVCNTQRNQDFRRNLRGFKILEAMEQLHLHKGSEGPSAPRKKVLVSKVEATALTEANLTLSASSSSSCRFFDAQKSKTTQKSAQTSGFCSKECSIEKFYSKEGSIDWASQKSAQERKGVTQKRETGSIECATQ